MGNRLKIRSLVVAILAAALIPVFQGPAQAADGHTVAEQQLFDMINWGRRSRGISAFKAHKVILRLERGHAWSMVRRGSMDHAGFSWRKRQIIRSDGGIRAAPSHLTCENVAYSGGDRTTAMRQIYRAWVQSWVHNRCMFKNLRSSADVAVVFGGGVWRAAFVLAPDVNPGCNANDPCG